MRLRPPSLALLLPALLLPAPSVLAADWPAAVVNPRPLPGDVLVAMPCGGAMAFRPILTPRPEAAPAGFPTPVGPFADQSGRHWYLLGKYEVNRRQYAAVRAWGQATGCPAAAPDTDALAQGTVSWHAATVFAATWQAWLRSRSDRLPDCENRPIAPCLPRLAGAPAGPRLPTGAEWEFATRGGIAVDPAAFAADRYPDASSVAAHAWHDANGGGAPRPIGRLRPNPLGLHDLYGNVAEWLRETDAAGPAGILRGGGFRDSDIALHSGTGRREGLYDAGGPRAVADAGMRVLIGAPLPVETPPTELAWCLGAGRTVPGAPVADLALAAAPTCPPPLQSPAAPAATMADLERQTLIGERDAARAEAADLRATLTSVQARVAAPALPPPTPTSPPGRALALCVWLNLLLALAVATLARRTLRQGGARGRQRSVSAIEVLAAWGRDQLDRWSGNLRPVRPGGPAALPDLTGLPAARVQALQAAAAEGFGLPVVIRQPDLALVVPGTGEHVAAPLPELVVIPGGRFWMGSPEDEPGRCGDEGPRHPVRIRPFAIGRTAVTFDQYDAFCTATGRRRRQDGGWGRGARPAINVSWGDAQAYLVWLRAQTGQRWRLPSEAEWEYAARAGTDTPFWTGHTIHTDQANYDGTHDDPGQGLPEDRCRGQTVPVGSLPANPFGLYEVLGNVWEWVEDCYHEGYGGAPTDGSPWRQGDCRWRVIRGGAWSPGPARLRTANRGRFPPADRGDALGFRVALDLPLDLGRARAAHLSGSELHGGPDPASGSDPA